MKKLLQLLKHAHNKLLDPVEISILGCCHESIKLVQAGRAQLELGSGSEWSGHFAAKMFTIFQTWLMNGLDPYAMLLDYFEECSKTSGKPPPDLAPFLPWQMPEARRAEFQLKQ